MPISKNNADDLAAYRSVAISFGHEEDLRRLGVQTDRPQCPACGTVGRRIGGGKDPIILRGFQMKTHGGKKAVLASCNACGENVSLPLGL